MILATWSSGPGQAPTCIHLSLPEGRGARPKLLSDPEVKAPARLATPKSWQGCAKGAPCWCRGELSVSHLGGGKQKSHSLTPLLPHFAPGKPVPPQASLPALPTTWRRRQWHPTPVLLPGKPHGRSLVGCSPWGRP